MTLDSDLRQKYLSAQGIVSLANAGDEQSLVQTANAMGVSERTLRGWAERWIAMGVVGVRRSKRAYVFARDFVGRWLACEIPSPNDAA